MPAETQRRALAIILRILRPKTEGCQASIYAPAVPSSGNRYSNSSNQNSYASTGNTSYHKLRRIS